MGVRLDTAGLSDRGGRPVNEDCLMSHVQGETLCVALADGLGGHAGGAEASRIACDAGMRSFLADTAVSPDAVRKHIDAADEAVRTAQRAGPGVAAMRSTLVMLVTDGRHAVWGHVGDSRLYVLREGRVFIQTKDHSVPQNLVEQGEMSPVEIRGHEDRNRLLRALGEERAAAAAVVAQTEMLQEGDGLLLCSDGFWEYVLEAEMEAEFAVSGSAAEWLSRMKAKLHGRVREGHDNLSAFAMRIG